MVSKYGRTECTKDLIEKKFLCDRRVFLWTYSWKWAIDKTSKSRMFLSIYYLLERQEPSTCFVISISKVLDNTLNTLSCCKKDFWKVPLDRIIFSNLLGFLLITHAQVIICFWFHQLKILTWKNLCFIELSTKSHWNTRLATSDVCCFWHWNTRLAVAYYRTDVWKTWFIK